MQVGDNESADRVMIDMTLAGGRRRRPGLAAPMCYCSVVVITVAKITRNTIGVPRELIIFVTPFATAATSATLHRSTYLYSKLDYR